jgi:hypothetical protein
MLPLAAGGRNCASDGFPARKINLMPVVRRRMGGPRTAVIICVALTSTACPLLFRLRLQELTISLFFRLSSSNDTIPVEVSDRRGGIFDETYTDLISSTP